jgi:hypothetical protein
VPEEAPRERRTEIKKPQPLKPLKLLPQPLLTQGGSAF